MPVFEHLNPSSWQEHYIWRLVASVVVTALVAFLAGAIAKTRGGITAAIANVPSVLLWGYFLYRLVFSETTVEGQTGFAVISAIAIPLTTWISYVLGEAGAETSASDLDRGNVLGIRSYHWVWLIVPIYFYSLGVVEVVAKFFVMQFYTWRDMSMVASFMYLLALVPILAWIAPIFLAYNILGGTITWCVNK
jgi:hypothetical protein